MGLLEKVSALPTGAKIGIASGAVLVAAAGVGLGVTQPWNQQNTLPVDTPPVQQDAPQEPAGRNENRLSVRAGNEVVDCSLYEGDGWSIYVPDGWSAMDADENGAGFVSADGAGMVVQFLPDSGGADSFVCLSADEDLSVNRGERVLQFYQDGGDASPFVAGYGPEDRWDYYSKLFTALARTLAVGDQSPFGEVYIIPQPADWQQADGVTVLFLDKDGYVVDDRMREAVEEYMKSWPEEDRGNYTGQYRIDDIQWAASYTGITEGYIDVFRANVQYRVAAGGEERLAQEDGGIAVVDGWVRTDRVFLAVFHDGGSVEKIQAVVTADAQDWAAFTALLA